MKNPLIYLKNVMHIVVLKMRYGAKLKIGLVQSFERLRLEIGHDATVQIGSFNQNRENVYMGIIGNGMLVIGNHCFFNINSSITCAEKIEIGNNCKFGNNLVIVDHDHNFRANGVYFDENPEFISSPISIGNNVWVGANVTILRGSVIGDDCVIGAGSIVCGKIPSKSVFVQKRENIIREVR